MEILPTYNEKVLIHNWSLKQQAEPRDNNPNQFPYPNNLLAAYKRLGTSDEGTPKSETQVMQESVWNKDLSSINWRKPILNFLSYPLSESIRWVLALEEWNKKQIQNNYREMDFITITKRDFVPQCPYKPEPKLQEQPSLERSCENKYWISELRHGASPKRRGNNMFMDDCLSEFYANRELKRYRYTSYNPFTGKYTT